MKVYTYCNHKNSLRGYQFAVFDLDSPDSVVRSIDANQAKVKIPKRVLDWFWDRGGWKLVLETGVEKSEALLLIQGIEKAVNFQRAQTQEWQEDRDQAARLRGSVGLERLSVPKDAEFYINLCFKGVTTELRSLAASLLNELRLDGGIHLLKLLLPALSQSELTHYTVDPRAFKAAVAQLQDPTHGASSISTEPAPRRRGLLPFRKASPCPLMQLDRTQSASKRERRKALDSLTDRLLRLESSPETLLLYVADGAPAPSGMAPYLMVDLDYILSTVTRRQ